MKTKTLTTFALGLGLAAAVSAQPVQTTLDGRTLQFDQPAMMMQGRVMVPLRGIFEALGADVLYDAGRRSIKATKGERVIELALGSRAASINGQAAYLDVPADSVSGRVMVPLRFVSEALGADVKWSAGTRTVALSSVGGDDHVSIDTGNNQNNNNNNNNNNNQADGPNIASVIHNARGGLNVGDRLVVTLTGDPGGQAAFDILGVIQNVPMREVVAGRYEGDITVTSGMQVNNGTLVGRLRLNGREDVMESRRAVSIQNSAMGGNINQSNLLLDVLPQPGSQVNQPRPTVQMTLNQGLQANSARVSLDGTDVTSQVQVVGNTLRFIPMYDLAPGEHRVTVQAMDMAGRWVNRDWAFSTYGTGTGVPFNPTGLAPVIQLTNLAQ